MKKSELLKIIREEVEVILTNEEAQEFFDLDVSALLDEMMTVSTDEQITEEELNEKKKKKQPSEKSAKKAETALRKTAEKKFPKDKKRQDRYIYGGKRNIGWKPKREKK